MKNVIYVYGMIFDGQLYFQYSSSHITEQNV
ncbi:hypothetical protein BALU111458_25955 [Bacillus luti]